MNFLRSNLFCNNLKVKKSLFIYFFRVITQLGMIFIIMLFVLFAWVQDVSVWYPAVFLWGNNGSKCATCSWQWKNNLICHPLPFGKNKLLQVETCYICMYLYFRKSIRNHIFSTTFFFQADWGKKRGQAIWKRYPSVANCFW